MPAALVLQSGDHVKFYDRFRSVMWHGVNHSVSGYHNWKMHEWEKFRSSARLVVVP